MAAGEMQRPKLTGFLNVLTGLLLLLTAGLSAGYVTVYLNPGARFNPFPPGDAGEGLAALPTQFIPEPTTVEPEATATPTEAPPTITRTPRPSLTPSRTPTPTRAITTTPFATLVVIVPTGPTATPTWTRSPFRFTVQGDTPFAVENVFNLEGCEWMGVGGQAYDVQGRPLIGYVVHLEGGGQNANSLTGTQPQYGPAGYEFKLADEPKATRGTYRVQLRDPQNTAVSDWIELETFAECNRNVLLVNFLQNH